MREYTMGKELDLKAEQEKTLATPVLEANFVLKFLFVFMDLLYGKKRTLFKFKIIELLARYPYMAWENRAYIMISKDYSKRAAVHKDRSDNHIRLVELGRKSQDNEQWHLMLIEEILMKQNIHYSWFKTCLMPSIMCFGYYYFSKVLYFINPKWSFIMNAKFESHAEHEYMQIVKENPEWETLEIDSEYFEYYPRQKTLADLMRRIGLDERDHMNESLDEIDRLEGKIV